jgi:hypothetical protein
MRERGPAQAAAASTGPRRPQARASGAKGLAKTLHAEGDDLTAPGLTAGGSVERANGIDGVLSQMTTTRAAARPTRRLNGVQPKIGVVAPTNLRDDIAALGTARRRLQRAGEARPVRR